MPRGRKKAQKSNKNTNHNSHNSSKNRNIGNNNNSNIYTNTQTATPQSDTGGVGGSLPAEKVCSLLFPGPPTWLYNDDELKNCAALMRIPENMINFLTANTKIQREIDTRFGTVRRAFDQCERGMTLDQLVRMYSEAGFDLAAHRHMLNGARPVDHLWKVIDLAEFNLVVPQLLQPASARPPMPGPEIDIRKCDTCKKICVSECECGESYCSRECQRLGWHAHKNICDTVHANNEGAFTLNRVFWGQRGVDLTRGRSIKNL